MVQLLKPNKEYILKFFILTFAICCISCKSSDNKYKEVDDYVKLELKDSVMHSGYILYDKKLTRGWFIKTDKPKNKSIETVKSILDEYDFALILDKELKDFRNAKKINLGRCLSEKKFIIDIDSLIKRRYKLIDVDNHKFYIFKNKDDKTYYTLCKK